MFEELSELIWIHDFDHQCLNQSTMLLTLWSRILRDDIIKGFAIDYSYAGWFTEPNLLGSLPWYSWISQPGPGKAQPIEEIYSG